VHTTLQATSASYFFAAPCLGCAGSCCCQKKWCALQKGERTV